MEEKKMSLHYQMIVACGGILNHYILYPVWLVWCRVASVYVVRDAQRRAAMPAFSLAAAT